MAKYLDDNGLLYLWNRIKTWVNSVLPTKTSDLTNDSGFITGYTETDPTVPSWAKQSTKPTYTASEVGALPSSTTIPTKTSDLTNDSGFVTSSDIPEGAAASTTTPLMDGTATAGSENAFARGNHVHPTDTSRAPLASPALTGTPTAPTAAAGTNTTQIATTAFVTSAIATASAGLASFRGPVTAASTITGASYKKGWYWVVSTAGTYVGETCEAGDMIFAIADKGSSYQASDFSVVQTNMDVASITNAEIDTITA